MGRWDAKNGIPVKRKNSTFTWLNSLSVNNLFSNNDKLILFK